MLRKKFVIVWRKRRVRRRRTQSKASRARYLKYREPARVLVHAKLAQCNAHYGFVLRKVFIKNLKSRWGSCSSRGNLNFNYRIVLLRPELQDYLVVHELCHLKAFNHSPDFWKLVGETIPHAKVLQKELRRVH